MRRLRSVATPALPVGARILLVRVRHRARRKHLESLRRELAHEHGVEQILIRAPERIVVPCSLEEPAGRNAWGQFEHPRKQRGPALGREREKPGIDVGLACTRRCLEAEDLLPVGMAVLHAGGAVVADGADRSCCRLLDDRCQRVEHEAVTVDPHDDTVWIRCAEVPLRNGGAGVDPVRNGGEGRVRRDERALLVGHPAVHDHDRIVVAGQPERPEQCGDAEEVAIVRHRVDGGRAGRWFRDSPLILDDRVRDASVAGRRHVAAGTLRASTLPSHSARASWNTQDAQATASAEYGAIDNHRHYRTTMRTVSSRSLGRNEHPCSQ